MSRLGSCLFVVLSFALATACGGGSAEPPVAPAIDLTGVDPAIAEAVETARAALERAPTDLEARARLAMTLDANGLDREAVALYRQLSSLAVDDHRWPYLTASALQDLDEDAALIELSRAAALTSDNSTIALRLGDLHLRRGDSDAARAAYGKALTMDPDSAFALYGLGRTALQDGDRAAAREHLGAALGRRPDFRQAHVAMAELLRLEGDGEGARLARWAASNHVDLSPPDPDREPLNELGVGAQFHKIRALGLARRGDFEGAEREYRIALELDPTNASHFTNLGSFLARQQRFDEAARAFTEAVELRPADGTVRNNLGQVLLSLGRTEEARRQFDAVVELGADDDDEAVRAHLNLATMAEAEGRREAAFGHVQSAVESSPGNLHALRRLGGDLLTRGRVDEAVSILERALRIDPFHHPTAMQLAVSYARAGRHQESRGLLESIHRQLPRDPRPALLLAWQLATAPSPELRDGDRALAMAKALRRAQPGLADAADVEAAALAETADFAAAIEAMNEAVVLAGEQAPPEYHERLKLYRAGLPYRQPG